MGLSHSVAHGRVSPEELQRMTFGAIRSVVSRFSVAGPTVLVLEDLHWADPTSLRLTLELAELTANRPLLVLATCRPDAASEIDSLTAVPAAQKVVLRPPPAAAAEPLARSLIRQVAARDTTDVARSPGALLTSAEEPLSWRNACPPAETKSGQRAGRGAAIRPAHAAAAGPRAPRPGPGGPARSRPGGDPRRVRARRRVHRYAAGFMPDAEPTVLARSLDELSASDLVHEDCRAFLLVPSR